MARMGTSIRLASLQPSNESIGSSTDWVPDITSRENREIYNLCCLNSTYQNAMTSYVVWGLLVLLAYGISRVFQVGKRPENYPPGPPTLPIIGNIHQVWYSLSFTNSPIPNNDLHLQLQQWAKEYGPVYSLILGTQTLIILSSPEAIKELLDKRSNIYSSRPNLYISQNLISGGNRMVLMKYDERWRMIRKMCHSLLNVQAARTYVPYQLLESKQMLNDLLDTPDDFVNHMRRYDVIIRPNEKVFQ